MYKIYDLIRRITKKDEESLKKVTDSIKGIDISKGIDPSLANSLMDSHFKISLIMKILNFIWVLFLIFKTPVYYFGGILLIIMLVDTFISSKKISCVISIVVAIIIFYLGIIK